MTYVQWPRDNWPMTHWSSPVFSEQGRNIPSALSGTAQFWPFCLIMEEKASPLFSSFGGNQFLQKHFLWLSKSNCHLGILHRYTKMQVMSIITKGSHRWIKNSFLFNLSLKRHNDPSCPTGVILYHLWMNGNFSHSWSPNHLYSCQTHRVPVKKALIRHKAECRLVLHQ